VVDESGAFEEFEEEAEGDSEGVEEDEGAKCYAGVEF